MAKFLNLHGVLRARPSSPNGPEGEQAILRLAVFATITSYAWFPASFAPLPMPERERILLMGLAGFLALAVGIYTAICISPASNVARRVLGVVADVGLITFGLSFAGEEGAVFVGVYFFITLGNGFRYGAQYLRLCPSR